ncbi:MAG: thiamine phosphate synthase [Alphaproteobacteria bacterium]
MSDETPCRLYLITPPAIDLDIFADTLAAALDGGDVACLQLRLKNVDADSVKRAAERLMPVCHAREVALIVNDLPEVAASVGADGVHVGADDADYATARKLVGKDAIVGVSCYDSRHLAVEAAEAEADYVAFGAFFATGTKKAPTRADPEILTWWREATTVPVVAIGGITVDNAPELVRAGADFLAVISGVWDYAEGPAAAVAAFEKAIAAA